MTKRLPTAILLCCLIAGNAHAQVRGPEVQRVGFDMASLVKVVHPMRHQLGGRMPMLVWELPIPRGDALIWSGRTGALRKAVDQLVARGIVPTVVPPGQGALVLAQTLQEAGQPVYVLIARRDLIESTAYQNCPVWASEPDAARGGKGRRWPCLPLADPVPGARVLENALRPLQDAGIRVAGVLFDDEGLPNALENVRQAQMNSPECRAHYPAGVLDDVKANQRYIYELRCRLIDQIMVRPVHGLFPGAVVGNFGELPAEESVDHPIFAADLIMPAMYAFDRYLVPTYGPDLVLNQQLADDAFFEAMIFQDSSAMKAAQLLHKQVVPYIGQALLESTDPRYRFAMSRPMWREVQYHLWLRGAKGAFVFNPIVANAGATMAISLQTVEDARAVYDDVLQFKEFLDKGEVMNLAPYPRGKHDPFWSGLRLADRCLVRAFTPFTKGRSIEIKPYEGVMVQLDAPPEGKTYLIGHDGKVAALQ